jgi:hypothetical protein
MFECGGMVFSEAAFVGRAVQITMNQVSAWLAS